MIIVFDHDFDAQGNVVANHVVDTANPAVQAMFTALKASVAGQVAAGYGVTTRMTAYSGQTRWQAILGEAVRLNDTVARPLLGV